jgi:putative Ca2+/H+ antiporter (TMEM165/GDT1 family)
MDWRTFAATFGAIFLAEMGDKTQLAAVTMAAQSGKPWSVFLGATAALAGVSALGVLVGGALGTHLPLEWVKRAGALLFIAIGVLMLFGKV